MPTYRRGDIVYARVPDPQGAWIDHDHPVIIWTQTAKIQPGNPIHVIVISHSISKPHPTGHIPMPWADGGHEVTGLKLESVAKCDWVIQLRVEELKRHIGVTPPEIMDLIYVELVARVKAKKDGK